MSVFVAGPGKHLFLLLRSARVQPLRTKLGGPPRPDLVVIPCQYPSSVGEWRDDLPDSVREQIRSGKATIVFDGSGEGAPHSPETTEAMHALLGRLGAETWRACLITQNRTHRDAYAAYCAARGVGRPMPVLVYDFWIKLFFQPHEATGEAVLERRLQAFRNRSSRRARRFVSLNWSLRPSKAFFLLRLMRDGLWDDGFISFGGMERMTAFGKGGPPQLSKRMRAMAGFEDLHQALEPYLPRLQAVGPVRLGGLIEEPNGAQLAADDPQLQSYDQSWFSAVTESEMSDEPARITEKPFKSLVNFHPIVLFGNPGALAMIREFGFRTFAEVIDESYDQEPDPRRRFEMAYAEFIRLCSRDEAELADMERRISETLEFNARFGLTRLPALFRDEIDRTLVDQLVALHRGGAPPAPPSD